MPADLSTPKSKSELVDACFELVDVIDTACVGRDLIVVLAALSECTAHTLALLPPAMAADEWRKIQSLVAVLEKKTRDHRRSIEGTS
jgi:hypothetical protein